MDAAETLAELLAEGLDLVVRAQRLDDPIVKGPDGKKHFSSPKFWAHDKYDNDLEAWKTKSHAKLIELGYAR